MIPYAFAWVLGSVVASMIRVLFPSSATIVYFFPQLSSAVAAMKSYAAVGGLFLPMATIAACFEAVLTVEAALMVLNLFIFILKWAVKK